MPDLLYLSLWLKKHDTESVLAALGKVLEAFPFSQFFPGVRTVSVRALDWSEPPALEEEFAEGAEIAYALDLAAEFHHSDCAYEIIAFWDLWEFRHNGGPAGWRQAPRAVRFFAYGPEFADRGHERGHLELDLGLDTPFLVEDAPAGFAPDYRGPIQANIRKLLELVRGLSRHLDVEKRLLWTESGENFAQKIERSFH